MGCVKDGQVLIEDRYIVRPGLHKAKPELGSPEQLTEQTGREEGNHTTIGFVLPLEKQDKFSHQLVPGQFLWLLLAYSQEDDFEHHSMMRTWAEIRL
jgi:hypothetical protein